jgi:predicted Zn-dependent protease
LLGVCIFGFVALVGGCAPSDSSVISQADTVHAGLDPAIEKDPTINNYLQQIGTRVQAAAKQLDSEKVGPKTHFNGGDTSWMYGSEIQFHLVNSKTLNAFTTGGHHVYVYNQLLQTTENEDQLAAVLSHEFAHIYCRHVAKGMQRQEELTGVGVGAGLLGVAVGGQSNGSSYAQSFSGAAMAAGQFIGMGFTRSDEAQADQFGFKFYTRAGWDPNHFGDFFQKMIDLGYDTTPGYASDHPTLASRVAKAKEYVAALPADVSKYRKPNIDTQDQFNQIKATAQQIAANTPDDQSLQKAQSLAAAFPSCVASNDSADQKNAQNQLLDLNKQKRVTNEQKQQMEQKDQNQQ